MLWFTALLAMSPCGDAYTVGGRRDPGTRSVVYGFPIRCAWLLIGFIYLFPGLAKLSTSGLRWVFSDNLRNQVWAAMVKSGEPVVNLASQPGLLRLAGLYVVAFEVGFIFLVWTRRGRAIAPLLGIALHIGIGLTLSIWFINLLLCYVVFLDAVRPSSGPVDERVPALGVQLGCLALVICVAVVGAAGMNRLWAVARYPGFAAIAGEYVRTIRISAETARGTEDVGPLTGIPRSRWESILQSVRPSDARRVRGLARSVNVPADASHLSVTVALINARTKAVADRQELLRVPL